MHGGSRTSLSAWVPGSRLHRASLLVSLSVLWQVQTTFLKQVGWEKGCRGKDFPEEELNVIFGNSIYMVKLMLLVEMGMEWGAGTT